MAARSHPAVDTQYLTDVLLQLLATPSPTGRTDQIVQHIGDRLTDSGLTPLLTRRGALVVTIGDSPSACAQRAVVAHADTIGAMVSQVSSNGRLRLTPVGSHSARFAEGARVTVFTDDIETTYTGTILPLMASGHRYGDEIDRQPVGWDHVEVRLDEPVRAPADVDGLGIHVGDHVAFDAQPLITRSSYVVSRHLDDKAGLAAVLTVARHLAESGDLDQPLQLLVTISEEVGTGASHVVAGDIAELVSVDNAVVAPDQTSDEHAVTVAMSDLHGPFDYHLSRHLLQLCQRHGIDHRRDVFRHYRSDVAAALESGATARAALIGVGVDASHGYERTHLDGVSALVRLLSAYATAPLTFRAWDQHPDGSLADFPSTSVQPAPPQPGIRDDR